MKTGQEVCKSLIDVTMPGCPLYFIFTEIFELSPASIPLMTTGTYPTVAWDKTDEGLITPSNQVPEAQSGTMRDSIEVPEIPGTNTAVPEIIGASAESNSEVTTICLKKAMKNELRIRGKLLQQPITISFYLGVWKPVEYLKGSGYNKEKSIF